MVGNYLQNASTAVSVLYLSDVTQIWHQWEAINESFGDESLQKDVDFAITILHSSLDVKRAVLCQVSLKLWYLIFTDLS